MGAEDAPIPDSEPEYLSLHLRTSKSASAQTNFIHTSSSRLAVEKFHASSDQYDQPNDAKHQIEAVGPFRLGTLPLLAGDFCLWLDRQVQRPQRLLISLTPGPPHDLSTAECSAPQTILQQSHATYNG